MSEASDADIQVPAGTVMSGPARRGEVLERGLLTGGKNIPPSSGKLGLAGLGWP